MSIFNGTADDIFNKKTDYPVGSVCMFNANIDPNEMYGGTWVRIKGKFILGADDDTYPLGSEGGEAETLLTEDQMPIHRHKEIFYAENQGDVTVGGGTVRLPDSAYLFSQQPTSGAAVGFFGDALPSGGNQPHNNMPPYVAFYIWAKVA